MTNKNIMVSVSMITYKHELYIREAIEGVLMQKVNFPVELIIADDCSPDDTSTIVQEIKENHPNGHWIKYFRHPQNIGMQPNGLFASEQCLGKYIAVCEGDDYWTDPNKLQKQVDFLEQNHQIVASFHNTEERCFDGLISSNLYMKKFQTSQILTIQNMLEYNIVPTSSLIFRKAYLPDEIKSSSFRNLHFGDWPLNLLLARNGDFYYLPFIMSVRRMHPNSIWGMQDHSENIRKTVESLKLMISYNWFENEINIKLERTIDLLHNKNKKKGLVHYLLNKIINILIKIKNRT